MNTARSLEREAEAVEFLRRQVRETVGDDAELFLNIIEGETNFLETLNAAAQQLIDDDGLMAGIAHIVKSLKSRAERIERRTEKLREAVRAAMERADIRKHESPCGTFSRVTTAPKTIVTDESIIPAQYWNQPAPILDKRSLLAALKNCEIVPGVVLSNRGEALQFRSG